MKGKTLTALGGLIALITLTSFGQVQTKTISPAPVPKASTEVGLGKALAQKAEYAAAHADDMIPTGNEVLAKIIEEIASGKVPAEIYPPGLFEELEKRDDQPIYTPEIFDRSASALKAGDRSNMAYMDPSFIMGSPTSEALRATDETQHTVTITYGFYIGKYPVTQGEYLAIVGSNPSYFTPANGYSADLNRPVDTVSWFDATNYCGLLTAQELSAGRIPAGWAYRLATEAEWEFSCRAGTSTAFHFGDIIHSGDANFNGTSEYDASIGVINNPSGTWLQRTTTVGDYDPNGWGLFDMHGNIWEWCQDWYDSYPAGSAIDPQGPASGTYRMIRGGSWNDFGYNCRAALRSNARIPSQAASFIGFRTVLAPIIPEWKTAITTTPAQPTFGIYPAMESGKDSLILATHGWNPPWADLAWLDTMTNNIKSYLTSHSLANWQVNSFKWIDGASTGRTPSAAQKALEIGKQEGRALGNYLGAQGWAHIHLIGHSAGAGVIQAATERIKALSPSTEVHCTFLDPFVGLDFAGVTSYGDGADWAENYFTRDDKTRIGGVVTQGPYTESLLTHAYNVDVTPLDPNKTVAGKFRSSTTGLMEPCIRTYTDHGWPHTFYDNTVTGTGVTMDYAGFGIPLSKEGGGWSSGVPSYTVGNDPAAILGTPDPTCTTDIQVTPPTWADTTLDFTQLPTIESDTGTIQKWFDSIKLFSGSPAWLATVVSSTNPVNVVSFNAQFTSTSGAQGLLTVYWDEEVIGQIDERAITTNRFTFEFKNAIPHSDHVLGFRLDPFTNIQSVVTVTNIVLNQVGISQPFSLALTGGTTNGALVYELTGEAGFNYHVEASTNLVDWTDIAILANTNGTVRFYEQGSTNYPMRFYRAVVP